MQQEEQIIECLKKLTDNVEFIGNKVNSIDQKVDGLEQKVDALDKKIDSVKSELDKKIDSVKNELEQRIDSVEYALDKEIDKVYGIALANKHSIEVLLIPYNDRNFHINEETAKIPEIVQRLDNVETVVGNHSEAIRKLQAASV